MNNPEVVINFKTHLVLIILIFLLPFSVAIDALLIRINFMTIKNIIAFIYEVNTMAYRLFHDFGKTSLF